MPLVANVALKFLQFSVVILSYMNPVAETGIPVKLGEDCCSKGKSPSTMPSALPNDHHRILEGGTFSSGGLRKFLESSVSSQGLDKDNLHRCDICPNHLKTYTRWKLDG